MKSARHDLALDTLAIHAGQPADPHTGAVMTPIVLSSTFAQSSPGKHQGFEYARSGNPTRRALEDCLCALEGGKHGFAFASGLAASTTVLSTLKPGDHILAGDDLYGGTFRLIDKVMKPFGIDASFVDLSDVDAAKGAMRDNTKMLWLETPTNPMLKIFDLAKLAQLAADRRVPMIVDNTFATPILQQPLALGATAVLHSTTKFLNGHSDVVGGAVISSDPQLAERLAFLQNAMGAVPSPFDCYLVLRGLKTLGVRVRTSTASAQAIAKNLVDHPKIRAVHYPGLESHPGYALAKQQMRGPGAVISFVLREGLVAARSLLEHVQIFTCAESLGGVESLAEHPAIMTHASVPTESRKALGIEDGLVRLSIGLEAQEDLWNDLLDALDRS